MKSGKLSLQSRVTETEKLCSGTPWNHACPQLGSPKSRQNAGQNSGERPCQDSSAGFTAAVSNNLPIWAVAVQGRQNRGRFWGTMRCWQALFGFCHGLCVVFLVVLLVYSRGKLTHVLIAPSLLFLQVYAAIKWHSLYALYVKPGQTRENKQGNSPVAMLPPLFPTLSKLIVPEHCSSPNHKEPSLHHPTIAQTEKYHRSRQKNRRAEAPHFHGRPFPSPASTSTLH